MNEAVGEAERLANQLKQVYAENSRLEGMVTKNERTLKDKVLEVQALELKLELLEFENGQANEIMQVLERSIPASEVQRIFHDLIQSHEDLVSALGKQSKLEQELSRRERQLRSMPKGEQLSEKAVEARKEVEMMRDDL